jgi:hypothetical protein
MPSRGTCPHVRSRGGWTVEAPLLCVKGRTHPLAGGGAPGEGLLTGCQNRWFGAATNNTLRVEAPPPTGAALMSA